jgi:hypothetical protein
MAVALVILAWLFGAAVSTYIYYRHRCGVAISFENGSESNPDLGRAVVLSAAWPVALFSERFRHPAHCKHPAHAEHWAQVEAAGKHAEATRRTAHLRKLRDAAQQRGRADLVTMIEEKAGWVEPLDATRMSEYQSRIASDLTGEEQNKLGQEELAAYLDIQLSDIPMPSWQKPDINGFREGDRVRLVEDFDGEEVCYKAGTTGTILITMTAPAQIRLSRDIDLHNVFMDDYVPDHPRIGIIGRQIERIPGHAEVSYSDGGTRVSIEIEPPPRTR